MSECSRPHRLAYFVSHPIQYQTPWLRALAARPEIELEVFFYSDFSLAAYHDKEFGRAVKWDVPLTEGYRHTFLRRTVTHEREETRYTRFQRWLSPSIPHLIREGRFDAVWVHGWAHWQSLQAVWAGHRLGSSTLLRGDTNMSAPVGDTAGLKTALKKRIRTALLNWLFRQVDGFLAVGTLNRKFYESRGVSADRIFDVPYAVDNAFFQSKVAAARSSRETLREELGLPPGRPVILFVAKLIGKKRPGDLLEAYRRLSPDNGTSEPDACLLFVGDGLFEPQLRELAQRTGWNSIKFAGFRNQSELPQIYDLCDVMVLPSDFEPWGLVLNEAMSAGRPVVVSDQVGAAADLVKPGQNGYIYPVGDVQALADCLQKVLVTRARSEQMGAASLAIIQKWGLEQACEALVSTLVTLRTRAGQGGSSGGFVS